MVASCCGDGSCVLSLPPGAPFLATKPFRFVACAGGKPREIECRSRCVAHKTRRVLSFRICNGKSHASVGSIRRPATTGSHAKERRRKASTTVRRLRLTTNDLSPIPYCQRPMDKSIADWCTDVNVWNWPLGRFVGMRIGNRLRLSTHSMRFASHLLRILGRFVLM